MCGLLSVKNSETRAFYKKEPFVPVGPFVNWTAWCEIANSLIDGGDQFP
jgi:hypothetical protein